MSREECMVCDFCNKHSVIPLSVRYFNDAVLTQLPVGWIIVRILPASETISGELRTYCCISHAISDLARSHIPYE